MWNGNLKTALASLRKNKWRSILTMMGIIIGVSSVITVVSLGEGLKHQVVGQIDQLGSNVLTVRSGKLLNKSGQSTSLNLLGFLNASTLTNKDVAAIAALPSVNHVTPINFVTNSAKNGSTELNNIYVIGASPNLPEILKQKIEFGDFFSSQDTGDKVVVVGSQIAQQLFGRLNPVGSTLTIGSDEFVVRGVLAPSSGGLFSVAQTDYDSTVFIPMPAAEALSGGNTNILQIIATSKTDNPNQAVADIKQALLKTHGGTENFTVLKQKELIDIATGVVNIIAAFISGIAAISLLVGGIGIMDIMLVSVSERTREIGIRKAIGATNRQILNQFLTEGVVLTVVGGFLGVLAAGLFYAFLRIYTHLQPVITLWVVLLALGVSMAVGIVFSAAPALKAARKDPIDALRGE